MSTTVRREPATAPGSPPGGDLPPGAQEVLDSAPAHYRSLYRRAVQGKLTRAQAILVQCRGCQGWTRDPCDNRSCPLWQVSPWGERKAQKRKKT